MTKKFHICRGDLVRVKSGNNRDAEGKVLQVLKKKSRAIIEGVNIIKKHQRKTQDYPNGTILEREGTIHISNLQLVAKGKIEKKGGKSSSRDKA